MDKVARSSRTICKANRAGRTGPIIFIGKNPVERIIEFLSVLNAKYDQQGPAVKILIPSLALVVFCCLCSGFFSLLSAGARNAPAIPPSPVLPTLAGTQVTPTPLFNFGSTLFPTLVAPTPLPTTPAPATATPIPTSTMPTSTASLTATFLPTSTNTNPPPTPTPTSGLVVITVLNKAEEYVEIQNLTLAPVDLRGWRLVSELGDQSCELRGTLDPNEVLRIWSRRGSPGFDCRFSGNVWRDNASDPAVLYDPQGQEVSRHP